MEKDIVPGLLDSILKDFEKSYKGNRAIERVARMIEEGTATYKEVNDYATWMGQLLSVSIKQNVTVDKLPDGRMYYNIAERILNTTLQQDHELITDMAAKVQENLNKSAGIGIKPVKPDFNKSRADGLINRLANEPDFEKVKWILDEPIVNFSQSIVDDTVKANMDFHAKAGLSPKITRIVVGNCCDWCKELAGTYDYGDEPEDIYRRHRYCRCRVDYVPGDGKRQNVWTKEWTDPEKDAKIEERKKIGKPIDYKFPNKEDVSIFQEQSDIWYQSIGPEKQEAIREYTDFLHEDINSHLRLDRNNSGLDKYVKNIDDALAKYHIEEDIKLYRGVGAEELKFLETARILPDYKSLTTEKDLAQIFLDMGNDQNGAVVVFNVRKGTKGAYIGNNSENPGENEFLIGRNAKVTSRRVNGILEVSIHEN